MKETNERIYEVDIIYIDENVGTCVAGAAIMSDVGITLKDHIGRVIVCYEYAKMKRNGVDIYDFNNHARAMTQSQVLEYWGTQINICSRMIKRGVFSTETFNSVMYDCVQKLTGGYRDFEGNGRTVQESDCPHYNG